MLRDNAILQDDQIITSAGEPEAPISKLVDLTRIPDRGMVGLAHRQAFAAMTHSLVLSFNASADFSFTVPEGYIVERIIPINNTANAAQLSMGLTSGGGEINTSINIASSIIGTSSLSDMEAAKTLSKTGDMTLYFGVKAGSGDTWNGADLTIYIPIKKII